MATVGEPAVTTPRPRGKTGPAVKSRPAPDSRRKIPSVDALIRSSPGRKAAEKFGHAVLRGALRATIDDIREEAARGMAVPEDAVILARAVGAAARNYYGISEVINATGVILHTGLGRAPLPIRAAQAAAEAAAGYSDLEVERETGARGRRTSRAEALLKALSGAEDALVVNNNAAALLLTLSGLGSRKEVLVSRGELIEIGGEFRLPEIMSASGAKLLEVGTTNRTRPADYQRALGPKTGLILKVHPSNYRVVGFTNSVGLGDLSRMARGAGVPLVYDVGSGLLDRHSSVPADEPNVVDALATGADLVTFSGDKLLGGPQAGVVVGRAELVDRLRRHPIARAVRVDKMTVAALESVLRLYATGRRAEIPTWTFLATPQATLLKRARGLATIFGGASARKSEAAVGGGSVPGYAVPSAELVVPVEAPNHVAARLRLGRPPVFCRVEESSLVFDLRTVPEKDEDRMIRAIRYALEQG
ncbi:MAG TPA: L-seryl-tRNA(Sec) selenium transferase [Actinomycetota bacterium]|nr:L-seryl-tRNA(Sec) selenium transferase [Actinomycetota bacterium]